uniref:Uncharacterized protein n=1 Tax=Ciona intestinalis TaxID=7719 RepID=H2XSL1_CIOIN
MKIEHVGSRPPSAIFLDEENMNLLQEQIKLEKLRQEEEQLRVEQMMSSQPHEGGKEQQQQQHTTHYVHEPINETTTTTATKTKVTRYIHKEGQQQPEKIEEEFEGRLTQEELAQLAADSDRIEVQVISYNTTRGTSSSGYLSETMAPDVATVNFPGSPHHRTTSPHGYVDTNVQTDVSQNTTVYTDVEEAKDGDNDVTTITKTYRTMTTERRLETQTGMQPVVMSQKKQ